MHKREGREGMQGWEIMDTEGDGCGDAADLWGRRMGRKSFFIAKRLRVCYCFAMAKKMVALRCAPQLLEKVNTLAKAQGKTRTQVIIEAVRLLTRTVQARGGRVVPPYDAGEPDLKAFFTPPSNIR